MIKVSVFYPHQDGAPFDMDYYVGSHMPMVASKLGDTLKGYSVDGGLAGGAPGEPPTYVAAGHLYFDAPEDFQNSFGPHAEEILGDIPNYTPIAPVIQISDIKVGKS